MIINFDDFQRVKSLRTESNVSLADVDGVVTISAAADLETDLTALTTRVAALEASSQPMLTNGPLPPGNKVLTLLVPELARLDRIQVG